LKKRNTKAPKNSRPNSPPQLKCKALMKKNPHQPSRQSEIQKKSEEMTPVLVGQIKNIKNAVENNTKRILILTGPGGSGKTTIADLLVEKCGFIKIDGDNLDTEFFPDGGQWFPENSLKLKQAHKKIFDEVKEIFNKGENNIVLDYIIFGDYLNFFEMFKKEFGNELEIKVLFPIREEMIKRDKKRECWTTGADRISAVRVELEAIKDMIGKDNFIDTTGQLPNTTFEKYFNKYFC
jgi:adenylate kinase family enzyme